MAGPTGIATALVSFPFLLLLAPAHAESSWMQGEEPATREVVAVIHPAQGRAALGVIRFASSGNALKVRAELGGLKPSQTYTLRIHEPGDCNARHSGSAWMPYGTKVSILTSFQTGEDGWTKLAFSHRGYSLAGESNPLLGRSVAIHDKERRLACGTVTLSTPEALIPTAPDRD